MPPFQDEPEEASVPQKSRRLLGGPVQRNRELIRRPAPAPTLFGEEPEEHSRQQSFSSSAPPDDDGDESSSDDEGASQPAMLNVGWSALTLFSKANFMKEAAKTGKPEAKKRPYNNTNRAQRAAESDRKEHRSYKSTALDPSRLTALEQSSKCKCGFYELSRIWVFESLSFHNCIYTYTYGEGRSVCH